MVVWWVGGNGERYAYSVHARQFARIREIQYDNSLKLCIHASVYSSSIFSLYYGVALSACNARAYTRFSSSLEQSGFTLHIQAVILLINLP
jgi:hypothetical protein